MEMELEAWRYWLPASDRCPLTELGGGQRATAEEGRKAHASRA